MSATITQLYTYPIKSCAGIALQAIAYTRAGLQWDRHWVIVDAQGQFMTQRKYPRMALIRPSFSDDSLLVRAPGMTDLAVPLETPAARAVPVVIWRSETLGQDEGDAAAQALSHFMGMPCRLLRVHAQAQRLASPRHVEDWSLRNASWTAGFPLQHAFGFADGFPFLLGNQASLDELNQQLQAKGKAPILMNRFRPNIVISGVDAYQEDYLSGIQIGDAILAFVKSCTRCPMPNVDQATAQVSDEPGLTLAEHRQFQEGILFGVNAVVSLPHGTLRVGDAFEPEYTF